jgi:branched-chain amino acid transport system permease protein
VKSNKRKSMVYYLVFLLAAIALPFFVKALTGTTYLVMILCISLIYMIAVTGLDILFGYSGQISMGHAAFFTIGAYTTGLLNHYFGLPLYITIPLGTLLPTIIGTILAIPASKLKFHFLSLATIAFGEITYYFLYSSPNGFTYDFKGISAKPISFLGTNYIAWYYFLAIIVLIVFFLKTHLVNSKVGRSFVAIKENSHAADGMGIDVRRMKVVAFAISAFLTGLAGSIYIHFIQYISPESAQQKQSVLFLTMLLFGGTKSIPGTIIGVLFIEFLIELIRPLQEYQMLMYGIMLLIVVVALPGGIYGGIKDFSNKLKNKKSDSGIDGKVV